MFHVLKRYYSRADVTMYQVASSLSLYEDWSIVASFPSLEMADDWLERLESGCHV